MERGALAAATAIFLVILAGCLSTDAPPELNDDHGVLVTGALEGVVLNEAGARVRSAHVLLVGTPWFATTNTSGGFFVPDLEPGTYRLRVDADGYLGIERPVEIEPNATRHVEVVLTPIDPRGAGYRAHFHDFWGGTEEYELFSDTVTWEDSTSVCTRYEAATSETCWYIDLPIEEGRIVPPGTAQISVVATWVPSDNLPLLELQYYSFTTACRCLVPYDQNPSVPLESGVDARFDVKPATVDNGHQKYTFWRFRLHSEPSYAGRVNVSASNLNEPQFGSFDVVLKAIKGGDLPSEEGHRRFWDAGDRLVLIDHVNKTFTTREPTRVANTIQEIGCGNDAWSCIGLTGDALVPPGTTRLEVTLDYEPSTDLMKANYPQKTMAFRTAAVNAGNATYDDLKIAETQYPAERRAFISMPLAANETDAFYQKNSLWLFFFSNHGDEREFTNECWSVYGQVCPNGTTFTVTVVAVNEDWERDFGQAA